MNALVVLSPLVNDVDPDNHTLNVVGWPLAPKLGTVWSIGSTKSFWYIPRVSVTGTDTFSYTASDGMANVTGVVTVTISRSPTPAVFQER
jgi:hypothetical protein